MDYKDYYNILGVDKAATDKEIKTAYRKLAREHHPDTNPGDSGERFKEINEAYEVLSDPDKRQKYEQFGSQWQNFARGGGNPNDFWQQWNAGSRGGGGQQTRTVSPEEFEQMFGGGLGGFSDFFDTLFGGAGMGAAGRGGAGYNSYGPRTTGQIRPQRGRDIEQPVDVTLEEAYRGTTRLLQLDDQRLEVNIPAGVKTGSRVRVAGKGQPGMQGGQAGDLFMKIEVLPHEGFRHEGDNLRMKVPVDLYTLLLGGEVSVPTLDKAVLLSIPAGTDNGKVFRLRGLGMPNLHDPKTRGDLFAVVDVQLPHNLSDEESEIFTQLQMMRQTLDNNPQ